MGRLIDDWMWPMILLSLVWTIVATFTAPTQVWVGHERVTVAWEVGR
jgi:hypothetical protein